MKYLVWCQNNYGRGYMFGGVYSSQSQALKRLEWCEKHTIDPENDSWYVHKLDGQPIQAPFLDGYGDTYKPSK